MASVTTVREDAETSMAEHGPGSPGTKQLTRSGVRRIAGGMVIRLDDDVPEQRRVDGSRWTERPGMMELGGDSLGNCRGFALWCGSRMIRAGDGGRALIGSRLICFVAYGRVGSSEFRGPPGIRLGSE